MSHYYPPGHPFHQPTPVRADSNRSSTASWRSGPSGGRNSSDSSLGTLSSCGTLFSDSGNSQDRNWRNGRVWTPLSIGSDNEVRGSRGSWSTSSSDSGSSSGGSSGGWDNPCHSTGASAEEDEARGPNLRADHGDQRPVTRQSLQTARVLQAVSDLRSWGNRASQQLLSSGTQQASTQRTG